MATLYYLKAPVPPTADRHRITLCLFDHEERLHDRAAAGFEPAQHGVFGFDEEVAENLAVVRLLKRSLVPAPPVPPPWRFVSSGGGRLERPDGTLWTPAVLPERAMLFQDLPAEPPLRAMGMVAFLDSVIGQAATTPRDRQVCRILKCILRRLRQRDGGRSDD